MKILVTGSNKGLGLEFVKQYLAQGEEVVATCRNPEKAGELKELSVNIPQQGDHPGTGSNHSRIKTLSLQNRETKNLDH